MRDFGLSMLELLQCCREKCFDFVGICMQGLGDIILGIFYFGIYLSVMSKRWEVLIVNQWLSMQFKCGFFCEHNWDCHGAGLWGAFSLISGREEASQKGLLFFSGYPNLHQRWSSGTPKWELLLFNCSEKSLLWGFLRRAVCILWHSGVQNLVCSL